jgi:hypothetical protein
LSVEEVDDALGLGHHFGADAVAGEQQEIVGCHFLRLAIAELRGVLKVRAAIGKARRRYSPENQL